MDYEDKRVGKLFKNMKYVFSELKFVQPVVSRIESLGYEEKVDVNYFERLEFLGDAVLNLVVSDMVFKFLPTGSIGVLTKVRDKLVSSNTLLSVSESIGLPMFLKAYHTRERAKGVLEDAVEALIGAIYLDGGLHNARKFIEDKWENMVNSDDYENHKSALQMWTEKNRKPRPRYFLIESHGLHHKLSFKISVSVPGVGKAFAEGTNRKNAEMEAASLLLSRIHEFEKSKAGVNQ